MSHKPAFSEQVALRLIEQLKAGTAPWQKPWDGNVQGFMPFNPTTGKRYKGINALWLMSQGREDARWLTYNQAQSQGAQVKKGTKGSVIQYWKFTEEHPKRDDQGQIMTDENGQAIKISVKLERPNVFHSVVFNAEQIEGLPPVPVIDRTWDPLERAEALLTGSNANIKHVAHDSAFYSPSKDLIQLPLREQFASADNYYATALHELGHWSGHATRLNRDLSHPFGSMGYAKEELRAEIASLILGSELGIGHDAGQHAAYVNSWIKVLEEDHLELFRAAADAEKIHHYVLALELQQKPALNDPLEAETQSLGQKSEIAQTVKIYINVPFKEKGEAKALGAKWDRTAASWYITDQANKRRFDRWLELTPVNDSLAQGQIQSSLPAHENNHKDRTYLAVPYTERQQAKVLGAKWDKSAKCWYSLDHDITLFERWLTEKSKEAQLPAMSPREEFAEALLSVNCIITGEHPLMDSQTHRIKVDGDKNHEKSGFYVGHLDDHPAGYVKNNRTGVEFKWRSKGYNLNDEDKAKLQAEAAAKQQARVRELNERQLMNAKALADLWAIATQPPEDHPYLVKKQVSTQGLRMVPENTSGLPKDSPIRIGADKKESAQLVKTHENNPNSLIFTAGDLLVPVQDSQDQLWSLQTIEPSGIKRFAKGCKMEGCFYVQSGMHALNNAPALIVSEGMATAKSIQETVNFPVVAAFSSGNLPAVVKLLHEQYPQKPVIVAGDDDRRLMAKQGFNPGREKAEQAAKAVGGIAIFPVFAKNETELTDFNDLKTQSVFGKTGLERQVKTVVAKEIEKQVNHLQSLAEMKQKMTPDKKIRQAMRR